MALRGLRELRGEKELFELYFALPPWISLPGLFFAHVLLLLVGISRAVWIS